eukprot:CAMPEP_0180264382 /NCGR_PEP_ID=MMETSP0987-20121128/45783_1 /TAXON_ID=697907 /ORGANISM="non described non described, Strain CCMP2293" /LENGTH=147 /DNA_ID=CAMNT_0022234671 /DNA_START=6 /DNA_END=447 /DNA_ORIENTATION=-
MALLKRSGWRPDSVMTMGDPLDPSEVLLLCFPAVGPPRHKTLWLRRIKRWSGCTLQQLDRVGQEAKNEWLKTSMDSLPSKVSWVNALGAADVIFAIKDERRGPFEALCFASDTLILIQESCSDAGCEVVAHNFQQLARGAIKSMLAY